MISDRKIANAMSGKTARACDCCIKKRARWYCPADDAFLCQTCDVTVHYANPLARRHDRVRLKTASLKESDRPVNLPTWHRGTTPKTRTPRKKTGPNNPNPVHMVPQLGVEETTSSQEEEGDDQDQLLYRVPMFDPFVVDLSSSTTTTTTTTSGVGHTQDGYLPSDLDLEEFAADVETLLGKGFDDHEESYGIQQLGLLNNNDNNGKENYTPNLMDFFKPVKEEDDVVIREPFDQFSFDYDEYDIPTTCEVQEDRKVGVLQVPVGRRVGDQEGDERENKEMVVMKTRKISLRLDYEAISEAWASHGSPWMNGHRPQINPDDCWPHCLGTCGAMHHQFYVDNQTGSGQGVMRSDGGREARVSRYREKRRTRLFSKKIRYEVRKLNAEKRPRMKGRFVKRSSAATVFPLRSK